MRSKLISLVVALAVAGGAAAAFSLTGSSAPTYTVTAEIEQAPNLFEGGRVMIRGVEVGKLTGVRPGVDGVHLTMEIQEGAKIPADAELLVVPITVISDRYVQFVPAYSGGPALEDGDHIDIARTEIPAELDDVLTQLKGLLAALEPKDPDRPGPLAKLIDDLDSATDGRSEDLAAAIEGSAHVLENLADSRTDITGLIQNLDTLFITLADRSSEIAILNERLQLVTETLAADQDDLEGTIENLADFSNEAAQLLADSGDDLGDSFGRLGRVLRGVLKHQDALLEATRWTNVAAEGLGATDASGKGLFAYSGRQAAPGTAGAAYNYRLDTRDTIACERIRALVASFLELNPASTIPQLRDTLMSFFPDTYKDDLAYLVDLLVSLCADLPSAASTLDERTSRMIHALEERIGADALAQLLVRWYMGDVIP